MSLFEVKKGYHLQRLYHTHLPCFFLSQFLQRVLHDNRPKENHYQDNL